MGWASLEMPLGSVKDIYNQCYKTFVHWLNVPIDYLDQSDYHQNHPSLSHPQPINEAPVTPSSIHHVSSLVKTTSNNFDLIWQVFPPISVLASPFHVLKMIQPRQNISMLAVDDWVSSFSVLKVYVQFSTLDHTKIIKWRQNRCWLQRIVVRVRCGAMSCWKWPKTTALI